TDAVVFYCIGILFRFLVVYAVHHSRLENNVRADLSRTQSGSGIRRKIRVARAARKNYDTALFQMARSAVPDVRLRDLLHRECSLDAHINAHVLKSICNGQRVHYRREHSDLIRSDALHIAAGTAAPEVAAADDDADLDAHVIRFLDSFANLLDRVNIQSESLVSGKSFSAQL